MDTQTFAEWLLSQLDTATEQGGNPIEGQYVVDFGFDTQAILSSTRDEALVTVPMSNGDVFSFHITKEKAALSTTLQKFYQLKHNRIAAGQRPGQARINALFEVDKELAVSLSPDLDCFYDDSKIYYFDEIIPAKLQAREEGDPWSTR